jgi:thiamine pyrophosphokinase
MRYKRTVIVAGGDLPARDIERIDPLRDWLIAVDGGAVELLAHGLRPHVLVGDMDTLPAAQLAKLTALHVVIERLPQEKDVTDTHYACEVALRYPERELILLGGWGGPRVDHALGNVALLEWLLEQGMQATMYAASSRLTLWQGPAEVRIAKDEYQYLSLLPLSEQVHGMNTHGLKYTLRNETLTRGLTRGLSNEWLAKQALLQIERGKVLLVESDDRLF